MDTLTAKQAKKIAWTLKLVRTLPLVPIEYLKKLTGTQEIWEIRAEFAGEEFRLLGFWSNAHTLMITNGFKKKGDKIPASEIQLATSRKLEFVGRK